MTFSKNSRLEKIGDICFCKSGLAQLDTPPGLRHIGAGAFKDCHDLQRVTLNEGVESLEDGVFKNSGLEEIELPSTLRDMSSNAFWNCDRLRVVWVNGGRVFNMVRSALDYRIEVRQK